ncbi:PREDICTED: vicilin-like seed storage protein At2g28490 [Ipomoea nil]|uniref:vicilin-like seed storage protein At2g28490 n=1 Tax=Ipomoea nil TaxID=35883 RepID=UPI000900F818|nr:PREDICTED: vicilin-like seed storage protein At2g28490 [Ipomoea nil]
MGKQQMSLLVLVLVAYCAVEGLGRREFEGEERSGGQKKMFILNEAKEVVRTESGVIKVVRGSTSTSGRLMHIGFITMEPQSLLIPQYLDSHLVLFINQGEARIGHVYKDKLAERKVKSGDMYTIEAGSAFYVENTAEGQRLHIICSINIVDTSDMRGADTYTFQSFFIGGGMHPTSVLAGFDPYTLSTALNVSMVEISKLVGTKVSGPIVSLTNSNYTAPILAHLKRIVHYSDVEQQQQHYWAPWLFMRKLLTNHYYYPFFSNNNNNNNNNGDDDDAPDSYNIFDNDKKPDFSNEYGWSLAVDENDYAPLKIPDVTVYLVNLTAGSMMAPHVNPRAIEYGIVVEGMGEVEVVYPNGTLAMNAQVRQGDVFWVPRFFPFCQIASRNGPFVFFGFTTSAKDNQPQFLVGEGSVMQLLRGPELAAALGLSEERVEEIVKAQRASTILPAAYAAPPESSM